MIMKHQTGSPVLFLMAVFLLITLSGCTTSEKSSPALAVPRGYVPVLEIEVQGRLLSFGPFAGYYFRPRTPDDLSWIDVVCFNERSFYTRDLPKNTLLFEGDALLTTLEDTGFIPESTQRITPVLFEEAPRQWLIVRPDPQDEYIHFHSCYDAVGPVLTGYWIRHMGKARFRYDMGGRVKSDSVLYHNVSSGPDKTFARIVEFDRGRAKRP